MVQIRMKRNLLVGCIVLIFVGISTTRATSEQCNQMFEAVVEMRSNLPAFLADGGQAQVQKLKKFLFYWTTVNVDDDAQLRRVVCGVVSANSLDEMAAAMRIPRSHFMYLYLGVKANALRYKMDAEEMLRSAPGMFSDARRQAMRALVNVVNVAESIGLQRFNPPPPSRLPEPLGCHTIMQLGLRVYNDREHFFTNSPIDVAAQERFRNITGIDINDRDHISAVLCKLGEVSDLTEFAVVFNLPVNVVRRVYPMILSDIRRLMAAIPSGNYPVSPIPEHVPQNLMNFCRGLEEFGLLNLS